MSSFRLLFSALAAGLLWMQAVAAQPAFNALARIDAGASDIADRGAGVEIGLSLSQPVPWRVFTLDAPRRLVLDFNEIAWGDPVPVTSARIGAVRTGALRPGWSRMVLALTDPMAVERAEMVPDPATGRARMTLRLKPVDGDAFAATAGAPPDAVFAGGPGQGARSAASGRERPLIVIDPGHGGVDPGAEYAGLREVDLMLTMAATLRETLIRSGLYDVILTRASDTFVPLERRIAIAREAGAAAFLSLHADSLDEGSARASGATVYTLSDEASDAASQALAERHDRDNLLGGVDLSGQGDEIALVLMDIARRETAPRGDRLADALLDSLGAHDLRLAGRPRRSAAFSVLKSADIPSVLIEVGFLTSPRDRKNLTDPEWRARMATAILDGLTRWTAEDAIRRSAAVRER